MWCTANDGSTQRVYLVAELGYGDGGELAITVGDDRAF
jgi:hypothetical protein